MVANAVIPCIEGRAIFGRQLFHNAWPRDCDMAEDGNGDAASVGEMGCYVRGTAVGNDNSNSDVVIVSIGMIMMLGTKQFGCGG